MLYQLKVIVFCWAGLGLGLLAWNYLASRDARRIITRAHVITVFALSGILFIQTNIYVWFAAAAIIPAFVALTTRNVAATLVVCLALTFRLTYAVRAGVYLGYFSTTTFIFLGMVVVLPFIRNRTPLPRAISVDLAVLTLFALQIIMTLRDPGDLYRTIFETTLGTLVPYLVLRLAVRRPEDVHIVQTAIVFAAIMLAGAALIETLWRWPIYHTVFGTYGIESGISAHTKMRGGFLRIPTVFSESTSFGVFLGLAIAFAVSNPRIFGTRTRQSIGVAIISAVIIVTFSRSAIIVGLGAVLMTMFYRGQIGRSLTGIAVLVAAIFGAVAVANINAGVAQFVRAGSAGEVFDYRELYWKEGIKVVKAYPLTGVSSAQALKMMASIQQSAGFIDPVNAYLSFAIRGGVFAALILFLLVAVPLPLLWSSRRDPPNSHGRRVRAGLFGASCSLVLAFAGTAFAERNPLWALMLAASAAAAVARPQRQNRGRVGT